MGRRAKDAPINNTEGLRRTLLETISDVRAKKIEPKAAQAVSNLSHQILQSARLDLMYARLKKDSPKVSVDNTKLIG